MFADREYEEVNNDWVADTPPEFRETLREILSDGFVKGQVVSLAASTKAAGGSTSAAPTTAG